MNLPSKLLRPDQYGNYWLGLSHQSCAAIFPAKAKEAPRGHFIASFGGDRGFLFDGPKLAYFQCPEQALRHMQSLVAETN